MTDELRKKIVSTYIPDNGEGNTMAEQAVLAITRLRYNWYNNQDVYDNSYNLIGYANDLSTYANWIYNYVEGTKDFLMQIKNITTDEEYEELLIELEEYIFDEEYLSDLAKRDTVDSIYTAKGPFKFTYRGPKSN